MAETPQPESPRELSESGIAERNGVRDELVNEFLGSDVCDEIGDFVEDRIKKGDRGLVDLKSYGGLTNLAGQVFDHIAVNYYYRSRKYGEKESAVAQFVNVILRDINYREVQTFKGYVRPDLFRDRPPKPLPEKPKSEDRLIPDAPRLILYEGSGVAANPDAVIVELHTDNRNGRKIAYIVGALDAKLQGVEDRWQSEKFKTNLWKTVHFGLAEHYPALRRMLDMYDILPEGLRIVGRGRLGVRILRPQATASEEYTKNMSGKTGAIVVPITKDEVIDLVKTVVVNKLDEIGYPSEGFYEKSETPHGEPFELVVNPYAIEKYDDTGVAVRFVNFWTYGSDEITGINFDVNNEVPPRISGITLSKDSEKVSIPIHIFRRIFYGNTITGFLSEDPMGISLTSAGGEMKFIVPDSPQKMDALGEDWRSIVRRIKVNGVSLDNLKEISMGSGV